MEDPRPVVNGEAVSFRRLIAFARLRPPHQGAVKHLLADKPSRQHGNRRGMLRTVSNGCLDRLRCLAAFQPASTRPRPLQRRDRQARVAPQRPQGRPPDDGPPGWPLGLCRFIPRQESNPIVFLLCRDSALIASTLAPAPGCSGGDRSPAIPVSELAEMLNRASCRTRGSSGSGSGPEAWSCPRRARVRCARSAP